MNWLNVASRGITRQDLQIQALIRLPGRGAAGHRSLVRHDVARSFNNYACPQIGRPGSQAAARTGSRALCWPAAGAFSPAIRELRLRAAAPAMITASASASPPKAAALVRMFSPNRNTPSRLAVSGSKMVNPGWEAASGPAASACEASSMVTAPAARSTYSDHAETMAPGPPP